MFGLLKDKSFLFSGLKEGSSGLIGTERSWEGGARRKCQQLSWASARRLQVCLSYAVR